MTACRSLRITISFFATLPAGKILFLLRVCRMGAKEGCPAKLDVVEELGRKNISKRRHSIKASSVSRQGGWGRAVEPGRSRGREFGAGHPVHVGIRRATAVAGKYRGYATLSHGLNSSTPVGSKSAVVLVITERPCRRAVAAIRPSLAGMIRPAFCATAVNLILPRSGWCRAPRRSAHFRAGYPPAKNQHGQPARQHGRPTHAQQHTGRQGHALTKLAKLPP